MTRTYAARRLLEHGPLTFSEVQEITGWPKPVVDSALQRLCRRGVVRVVNCGGVRRAYRLAS